MLITRTSMVSGVERTRDLAVTPQQMRAYENGALIQNAFPHLSDADREFILTGITDEEWNEHIRVDDEDTDFDDDEVAF